MVRSSTTLSSPPKSTNPRAARRKFRSAVAGALAFADLPRIFEPFYRSPHVIAAQIHGAGLGLSIAKSMIEAVGGRLSVVSEVGAGSTFTLHLPVADGDSLKDILASSDLRRRAT